MIPEARTAEHTPIYDVSDDIYRELVLRIAKADRDRHRDIYDILGEGIDVSHPDLDP